MDPDEALWTAQRIRMSGKSVMGMMSVVYISYLAFRCPATHTKYAPDKVCWLAFELEA
jgi:hypothetical protein